MGLDGPTRLASVSLFTESHVDEHHDMEPVLGAQTKSNCCMFWGESWSLKPQYASAKSLGMRGRLHGGGPRLRTPTSMWEDQEEGAQEDMATSQTATHPKRIGQST